MPSVNGNMPAELNEAAQPSYTTSNSIDRGELDTNRIIPASDQGYFNQDPKTAITRFPGSQAVIENQVSSSLNVKPTLGALPSLANGREVLPSGVKNAFVDIDSDKVLHTPKNRVTLSSDSDKAQSQVWNQSLNKDHSRIHVEYLTTMPIKFNMPVQQLKQEWEKGQFDLLNTTNADNYKGESVYLPWKNNERTAPGDWKVFANNLASKYYQMSDKTSVFADLDSPLNYDFDTQKVAVGMVEERIHSKQFAVPQAQALWETEGWDSKLLTKPDNYHAEEVMQLPWSSNDNPDSVHILTWWRFLNELGGYHNP